MHVERDSCASYLERLGFGVEMDGDDLVAEVPPHRHYDVSREVDLIEEVGRLHGYAEHLPATLPKLPGRAGGLSREQTLRRRAEDAVRDLGFDAVVTLSLTDPGMPGRLGVAEGPGCDPIRVSNPLSIDHSELRTSLLGSLLGAARYNVAHGAERVALFESGRAYLPAGRSDAGGVLGGEFAGDRPAPAFEPHRIGCLAVGPLAPRSWRRGPSSNSPFFELKGVLETLAAQLGAPLDVTAASEPFLHPGRSAHVSFGGREAGWIGELHPLVCREWDLERAAGFEVGLAELVAASPYGRESYEDVISYPAVRQDVAVVVDEDVSAEEVRSAVLKGGGELLRSARIFDLYRGEQVGEGRKSLALTLEFRAADRTLTDAEVAERRDAIRAAVAEIGGSLRE
jgi:phenylalanyl-tRNA synthetase beta chain